MWCGGRPGACEGGAAGWAALGVGTEEWAGQDMLHAVHLDDMKLIKNSFLSSMIK